MSKIEDSRVPCAWSYCSDARPVTAPDAEKRLRVRIYAMTKAQLSLIMCMDDLQCVHLPKDFEIIDWQLHEEGTLSVKAISMSFPRHTGGEIPQREWKKDAAGLVETARTPQPDPAAYESFMVRVTKGVAAVSNARAKNASIQDRKDKGMFMGKEPPPPENESAKGTYAEINLFGDEATKSGTPKCICALNDLLTSGCRCGAMDKEKGQ
jgi:hypothetical protein